MSILDYSNFDDDESDEGRADRFEDELKRYKDMLGDGSSDITNIEALEEIVNFFFDNERYEEALRFIDRMLAHIPYNADTWQRKGLIPSNLNRPAEALEAFTMALNLNPVDTEILVNRGIALDELGRFEEAVASYNQALEIEPTHDSLLVFPSSVRHEVERISCPDGAFADGRFAVNIWLCG